MFILTATATLNVPLAETATATAASLPRRHLMPAMAAQKDAAIPDYAKKRRAYQSSFVGVRAERVRQARVARGVCVMSSLKQRNAGQLGAMSGLAASATLHNAANIT